MIEFPWSLAEKEEHPDPIHTHHKRWRFFERHLPNFSIGLMVLMLVAAVLYPHMVITVPSGHVGVLWKRFNGIGIQCWCLVGRGTVLNPKEIREEGLHLIWPWDELFIYDLRLQSTTETYNAISKEGVSLTATINIRFQLRHNAVALMHKFIGPGYIKSIVQPEIGSRTREIIGQYTAEQVYSTLRPVIEKDIRDTAQQKLNDHLDRLVQPEASEQLDREHYKDQLKNAIEFIDTLVLGITLPPTVVGAINRKTEQYYLVQEYQFRVEREAKESERKQIEANGIAAFQRTVSGGITESYLRWRGIDATLELAKSKNSKVVIVGGGKDGLPIILGNVNSPPPSGDTPKPPTDGTPDTKPPTDTPPSPDKNPTGDTTPTPPDKKSSTNSSKTPNKDKDSGSSFSLSFSDLGSLISQISNSLKPTNSDTKPKPNP